MSPSSVVEWLEGLQGPWPYLGVLVVAFAEHALFVGTFLPGEVILPLTGVAAATTGVVAWPVAAAWAGLAVTCAVLAWMFLRLRAIGAELSRAAPQGDVRDA